MITDYDKTSTSISVDFPLCEDDAAVQYRTICAQPSPITNRRPLIARLRWSEEGVEAPGMLREGKLRHSCWGGMDAPDGA